jgi:hypothetical protein
MNERIHPTPSRLQLVHASVFAGGLVATLVPRHADEPARRLLAAGWDSA